MAVAVLPRPGGAHRRRPQALAGAGL